MPVTILNPYRSEPWAHAVQGLSGALEAFTRYKADDRDYKLRVEAASRAREDSEQMRKVRDQDMFIRDTEQKRLAEEDKIREESERVALGEGRGIDREIADLGDMVDESTKTQFDSRPLVVPPLWESYQPKAPLEAMIQAPQLDQRTPAEVRAEKAALRDAEFAVPTGKLSPRDRALGREAITDKSARKEASRQEAADYLRETVAVPNDMIIFGQEYKKGERVPSTLWQLHGSERAQIAAGERNEASIASAEKRQERANEASFRRAEIAARRSEAAQTAKDDKEKFRQESTIRKEYDNVSRKPKEDLRQMERYSGQVNQKIRSGVRPSAADQYGLIYAFNKALDPSSVVRESEFMNTTRVAAGYVDRAYRYYKQIATGEMLTDRQIEEMMEIINNGRDKARQEVDSIDNRFRDIAIQNKIDPSMIFGATAENARKAKDNPEDPEDLESVGDGQPSPGNPAGLTKPPPRRP